MINNSELKYIQSFAHKKHWVEESVFIVEGPKLLEELLASDWVIRKIMALSDWIQAQGALSTAFEIAKRISFQKQKNYTRFIVRLGLLSVGLNQILHLSLVYWFPYVL